MKLQDPIDFRTRGPAPLIFYKSDKEIGNMPIYKEDSLKVDIKTQPGEKDSETVAI